MQWCCAICILRGLIWQRVCYLELSWWLFATNCVVVMTQYWNSNHFHYQWIHRQNKKLQMKCIPEWLKSILMKRMRRRPDFLWIKMRHRQDLSNKMFCRLNLLTKSSWVLCPVNAVRKLLSTNLSSESSSLNQLINSFIN